mmetsp:Transcript_60631/g.195328  ORF Transcript_60631/g.195328 Transcript_60631/m.195328 type:complete len:228 (+) Transcript_60631:38-721(+)
MMSEFSTALLSLRWASSHFWSSGVRFAGSCASSASSFSFMLVAACRRSLSDVRRGASGSPSRSFCVSCPRSGSGDQRTAVSPKWQTSSPPPTTDSPRLARQRAAAVLKASMSPSGFPSSRTTLTSMRYSLSCVSRLTAASWSSALPARSRCRTPGICARASTSGFTQMPLRLQSPRSRITTLGPASGSSRRMSSSTAPSQPLKSRDRSGGPYLKKCSTRPSSFSRSG